MPCSAGVPLAECELKDQFTLAKRVRENHDRQKVMLLEKHLFGSQYCSIICVSVV
jgi:hypothetical protein